MRSLKIFISLLALCTSCSAIQELPREAQEAATWVRETRVQVTEDVSVTKNGVEIGTMQVKPTRFRPNVNNVRYQPYYGLTITYTFR